MSQYVRKDREKSDQRRKKRWIKMRENEMLRAGREKISEDKK